MSITEHGKTITLPANMTANDQRTERIGACGQRLAAIARGIAAAEVVWRPLVRHDPAARWFLRLYRAPLIEAWLLSWTSEQAIELHDHGGACGAVLVVDGELVEQFSDLATHAPLAEARLLPGRVHCFGAAHVHDLRNAAWRASTSIHVYSPPLSAMTFYRRDRAGLLVPSRVEAVADCEPGGAAPAF